MRNDYLKNKGFTLIELLVVIAIIGLLASIILVSVNSARIKARDTKRKADLAQLSLAAEMYYDSNSTYPGNATTAGGDWPASFKSQLSPYISNPPIDPKANASGVRYYGAYRMTWAPDNNCNGHYVFWAYFESSSDPDWGKYTCGFGTSHYFVVLGDY